jgi:peptidoglycan hydrolase-like protein with peptidoglycan-binding domain
MKHALRIVAATIAILLLATPTALATPSGTETPALRIGFGAGYERPHGLPAVRHVQRRLRARGYPPGPIDGLFGPRTQAAVQLFQTRHGLPATGVVNRRTFDRLGFHRQRPPVGVRGALDVGLPAAPPGDAPPADAPPGDHGRGFPLVGTLVALLAVALVLTTRLRKRRRASEGPLAVGYAADTDPRDIEQACSERGWTLGRLVSEEGRDRSSSRRAALAHALAHVSAADAGRLVVGRLDHLAGSPAELATVLDWCAEQDVGVVALDVGLDTTTADGNLAARCLVATARNSKAPA